MMIACVSNLRKRIGELEARLVDLKNLAVATSKALDGMPHAKARSSPVERIAVEIVDTENELTAAKAELEAALPALVEEIIERVEAPMATVLICRYVEGLSFRETARRTNYCLRNIFALHKKALAEYERCCDQ